MSPMDDIRAWAELPFDPEPEPRRIDQVFVELHDRLDDKPLVQLPTEHELRLYWPDRPVVRPTPAEVQVYGPDPAATLVDPKGRPLALEPNPTFGPPLLAGLVKTFHQQAILGDVQSWLPRPLPMPDDLPQVQWPAPKGQTCGPAIGWSIWETVGSNFVNPCAVIKLDHPVQMLHGTFIIGPDPALQGWNEDPLGD